jgi:hypothetical protein
MKGQFDSDMGLHLRINMIKRFRLLSLIPEIDVEFLNTTHLYYEFDGDLDPYDSGWCDASTGARIVTRNDRITFSIDDVTHSEDLLHFKLKFEGRYEEVV